MHSYAGSQAPALIVIHKCLRDTVIPAGMPNLLEREAKPVTWM